MRTLRTVTMNTGYDDYFTVSGLAWGRTGALSHARTDTVAAYAFDTVHFNPRWQANAGVRFDRYRTELDGLIACSTTRAPLWKAVVSCEKPASKDSGRAASRVSSGLLPR